MMNWLKRLLAGVATGGAFVLVSATGAHAADYSTSRLMDDSVFDNAGSMGDLTPNGAGVSAAETAIQSFLVSKGTCLKNYTDVEPTWTGSAWTYTGSIPASRIIAKVARQWGINPQVILAALQKEESLVSGTSCDSWRYVSAMGYGCFDGSNCNAKYSGFTRQVLWASWQLKFNKERSYGNTAWDGDGGITYSGRMTQGDRKRCDTCQVFSYDGNTVIDGQTIHLDNGATASFYTYTPHLGQALPGVFESYFGSVMAPTYAASFAGQSAYPTVVAGNTANAFMMYANTGNQTWYDDSSVAGAPAGSYAVHLATGRPMGRSSVFGATWQRDRNRPAMGYAAVYENDGVTLASNQHQVTPGQIAKFAFIFTVDQLQAGGKYREYFQPVAEGSANGLFGDPGTYLDVTVQPATWTSSFAGQSVYPIVAAGNTASGFIRYQNTSNQTWYDDSSIGTAQSGTFPVHLATARPMGRSSVFGATWQRDRNRPSLGFSKVYESDGVTLASNQHQVGPGQIARFDFTFTVAANQAPGVYREFVQPVAEGTPNGAFGDTSTYLDVTVQPIIFAASFAGQSAYPTIMAGSSSPGFLMYRNTGNQTWYDDSSVAGAPAGSYAVHLATGRPMGRSSVFGATWQRDRNRPAMGYAAVYENDGVTLASNQHQVTPGQIAKFAFIFTVDQLQAGGKYREYFQPVAEGSANGLFGDPGTYLDVTVQPATWTSSFAGQSVYPIVAAGNTASGFIRYQNTSNQTWYDDSSIGTAQSGTFPVHLATARPMGRSSVFGATWQRDRNRPAMTFGHVYESDNVTAAANQHVVAPGQIVEFDFTFTVPAGQKPGIYREYFQPVAEGSANGLFGDIGTYLDVTVR